MWKGELGWRGELGRRWVGVELQGTEQGHTNAHARGACAEHPTV